jgi:hypothetical protein
MLISRGFRPPRVVQPDHEPRTCPAPAASAVVPASTAASIAGLVGVVVAVGVLAREGDEETAGLGQPAVEHGRRGHPHRAVALDRAADNRGYLADAKGDHSRPIDGLGPASESRLVNERLTEADSLAVMPTPKAV